jgi:tetratricopeptide (TPR) repeat protein
MTCKNCGADLKECIKFCPECGTKVGPKVCGSCNAELAEGVKFCPDCGTKVDNISEAIPALKATARVISEAQTIPPKAEQHFNTGEKYLEDEDYDSAISEYIEAIKLYPDFNEAIEGIEFAVFGSVPEQELFNALVKKFSSLITTMPNITSLLLKRAKLYFENKDYKSAIKDCTEAIKINPNDAEAFRIRGYAYGENGNFEKALEDCNMALRLKPDFYFAYYTRSLVYALQKKYKLAITDLTTAIDMCSDFVIAYEKRGIMYYMCNKFDDAIVDLSSAITQREKDNFRSDFTDNLLSVNYSWRGSAYYEKGEYKNAMTDYNTAVRLNPDFPKNDLLYLSDLIKKGYQVKKGSYGI